MLVAPKFIGKFQDCLFDWESDGLLHEVTQAWCMSAFDLKTEEIHTFSCADGPTWWEDALDLLENAKLHSSQNGYAFDYPLMKLLYGIDYQIRPDRFQGNTNLEIYDTYILSQVVNPEREEPNVALYNKTTGEKKKIGKHSVESYGHQFGLLKREIQYWDTFSPAIVERCEYDCRIQAKMHKYLIAKLGGQMQLMFPDAQLDPDNIRVPTVASKPISLEHCLARHMNTQEENGTWLNQEKCNTHIDDLEVKIEDIEEELDPLLPMLVEMVDTKVTGEQLTHGVKKWSSKKGLSKTTKEWFDPEKTTVIKERGAKRKDGTKATRTYIFPPFPFEAEEVVEGPFCRVGWFKLELSSPTQVSEFLYTQGWKPTEWNQKKVTKNESKDPNSPYHGQVPNKPAKDKNGEEVLTTPKLTEDSFESIKGNTGKLIANHRTYNHRKKFLQGLLRNVREDGRICQGAITHGAITGRMQHRVIVNTPRASSLYGLPCREGFEARPPYWNFGADLSSLEDRMKAHYIYKYPGAKEYINKILDPLFDVHEENASLWDVSRTDAKSPKYLLDYNGGAKKLAKTLGVSKELGQRYYDAFWGVNKPLKMFNDEVTELFRRRKKETGRGWVKGLDGRVLYPRSPHGAGNMLFQSAGNIVAKTAVCLLGGWAEKNNVDGWQWSFNHDEYQWNVHEKHIKAFHWFDNEEEAIQFWKNNTAPLKSYHFSKPSYVDDKWLVAESPMCHAMVWAFIMSGKKYNIRVDTTGECMVGHNWSQCH